MSDPAPVPVVRVSPGVFFNVETGEGAVLAAGTGLLTSQHPVAAGEFLEIYATGLRTSAPTTGTISIMRSRPPQVWLNGREAEVTYSGVTPQTPGLYQVNARVPDGLSGSVRLVLEVEGRRSNEVTVVLR
jgi:uncharacterized protein (TIGR03437 family)